ncbi:MAG: hypothetical protein ACR2PK_10940 [Acidimicrobiales bacterium]
MTRGDALVTGKGISRTSPPERPVGRRALIGFAVLAVLYLVSATWTTPYNVDSYTNAVQARAIADDGSPIIEEYSHLLDAKYTGQVVWIVEAQDGPTSQYPPGVALWGAGFYLLDTSTQEVNALWTNDGVPEVVVLDVPSLAPAALAAVTATLLAMVFFARTLRPMLPDEVVMMAVALLALGTGAWSVAADQLWQHSPGMMFISMGVYAASRDRFALSGLAFAGAALVRPHTLLIAAAVGLFVAIRRRDLRPALRLGSASAIGLVAVVLYNRWVWDSWSVSGGYGDVFAERARGTSPLTLLSRFVEMLFDLDHGLLVSSSFIVVALIAVVTGGWRGAPDWAIGAAVGAVVYLVVQLQANRVSGGNQIFGYRYPLEALMAAAPLLALATHNFLRQRPRWVWVFAALAMVSVIAHGYGAIFVSA